VPQLQLRFTQFEGYFIYKDGDKKSVREKSFPVDGMLLFVIIAYDD
jgi:hypothetical protein